MAAGLTIKVWALACSPGPGLKRIQEREITNKREVRETSHKR